ncbi:lipopolysaccharide biosynthesis protein [Rhodopirellula baltica SH28]|uniref:Lipopolysaccharide biosynthesis protein n=1 Tax=Rhodopirellula baltica SH28 TaxID=993517 RepID=K5CXE4_RHOBT|nr:lipopolysaccharide biosynthesis protein [Rhodopirellula baltica SH28]
MTNAIKNSLFSTRTKNAAAWSTIESLFRQLIAFGVGVVLARQLGPETYGTIAVLYLFTGIATVFADAGFGAAIIQRRDIDDTDLSTVFWFNLTIGGAMAMCLCITSGWISKFYEMPILRPLTCLMGFNVFLSTLGSVQASRLQKNLAFKNLALINLIAMSIAGALAIGMAYRGYGVWSLATQSIAATSITVLLLWADSPWRPDFTFSRASLRKLFAFGGYLLASAILAVTYERAYTIFVGKLFGPSQLGFYDRATRIQQMPQSLIAGVVNRIAFPLFSSINDDVAALRDAARTAITSCALTATPVAFGLSATANEIIAVVFGEAWLPTVPIVQILAFVALLYPLQVVNLSLLKAQGHSHLFFRLEVIKKLVGIAFLAAGLLWGIVGLAFAQVISSITFLAINSWYTGKFMEYGFLEQAKDMALPFVMGLLMAVTVGLAGNGAGETPLASLVVKVLVGVTIWSIFLLIVYRKRLPTFASVG